MATDTTFTTRRLAEQLRGWAAGMYGTEAAVELLIRAVDGRLLTGPWIRNEDGAVWFEPAGIDQAGYLSGGAGVSRGRGPVPGRGDGSTGS